MKFSPNTIIIETHIPIFKNPYFFLKSQPASKQKQLLVDPLKDPRMISSSIHNENKRESHPRYQKRKLRRNQAKVTQDKERHARKMAKTVAILQKQMTPTSPTVHKATVQHKIDIRNSKKIKWKPGNASLRHRTTVVPLVVDRKTSQQDQDKQVYSEFSFSLNFPNKCN